MTKRTTADSGGKSSKHDRRASEPGAGDATNLSPEEAEHRLDAVTSYLTQNGADRATDDGADVEDDSGYASAIRTTLLAPAPAPPSPAPPPQPDESPFPLPELLPDMFFNRELSWLDFNQRVLEEAMERDHPLLERVKFAAIFSSNFEGWCIIRLAGVRRKVRNGITVVGPDGRTPVAQFAAIRRRTQELLDAHARVICNHLIPELREAGISIVPHDQLSKKEQAELARVFQREIFPVLTPQAIDVGRPFPHVSSGSLNLLTVLQTQHGTRFARTKVPAPLPRLIAVPTDGRIRRLEELPVHGEPVKLVWLEDLIAANMAHLFPGTVIHANYPFYVLRDADVEPDEEEDDSHNLMMIMRETLSQRPFGPVVSVMVDRTMPTDVRDWLVEHLQAEQHDLTVVNGPLAGDGLFDLLRLKRPDLQDPPYTPKPVRFIPAGESVDAVSGQFDPAMVFDAIRERDILVHHPYQSFDAVVDFMRAASSDANVVAIKQTLYRLGKNSPLIPFLIEARDDDTQVAVLVELRARFDEESNIQWAEELERKGVHVAYGLPGLKTHCKATLVVRREPDGLRRYVHLATGNYNASTARVYEDLGLFTAREDIGEDVSQLFNSLTGFNYADNYRKLWVAPVGLRRDLLRAIGEEIAAHQRTGKGRLIFKMNQLVDRQVIRALYAASRAGVKVDLIVRGICCLRPGVPGWSENIRVRSIVGRFLEHSRIYYFANGGKGEGRIYLGSADLMERNLDRRVEAIFPIEDERSRRHIRDVLLPAWLRDTVNARELQEDGTWTQVKPKKHEEPFDSQRFLMEFYPA